MTASPVHNSSPFTLFSVPVVLFCLPLIKRDCFSCIQLLAIYALLGVTNSLRLLSESSVPTFKIPVFLQPHLAFPFELFLIYDWNFIVIIFAFKHLFSYVLNFVVCSSFAGSSKMILYSLFPYICFLKSLNHLDFLCIAQNILSPLDPETY